MATTLANLNGDLSDIMDQDFTKALVRIRANTTVVVDPDNDKVRLLEAFQQPANGDGTFSFTGLIAGADTIVPGTLQYYLGFKAKGLPEWSEIGPFVLSEGDQDVTDLQVVAPVVFDHPPDDTIDTDILTAAEAYTDAEVDGHIAASNPHTQYARIVDTTGTVIPMQVIRAYEADPFPPVVHGALLIKGGF